MSYTFSTNVPQAAQKISATQVPIQSNFQAVNEFITTNHVGFTDPDYYGMHTYLSLPSQASNPTTSSSEMAIFCAPSTGVNPYELYYRYPSSGTIVQLSGSGTGTGAATSGFAYLSSTVFLKWGTVTGITTGANTITFPTGSGIPVFSSTPYEVYYTQASVASTYLIQSYISSSSATQFVLEVPTSGFATSIYWLALGV
ncbi:hypothetical protein UFOVP9_12 [uncultured Caudovirales phage]|jgi:hypothetical protein|uniref:Uncharacterized protein n=1 Tax=uncultured Caudovirales phage TaxID=2100421 RepID=A0A6J5KGN0_9CAUD|nr:hypothetical protein UFOVP9_12 [uncultured Caudovirales phage]